VDEDRLYTLGAGGDLHCLRTTDGSVLWHRAPDAIYIPTPEDVVEAMLELASPTSPQPSETVTAQRHHTPTSLQ
jgi:hypothetical protein